MSSLLSFGRKIIRPKKQSSKKLYLAFAEASLVSGDMNKIVQLPDHLQEYENEWIAINTFDFFNSINSLFSSLSEFCTSNVAMDGPDGTEYSWVDSQKRSTRVSAPQYIDYMTSYIQSLIDNDAIFPTKSGTEFPHDFKQIVRGIFKQYIRLFAHVYHAYFEKVLHLEQEAHWNTLFAHVVVFGKEYDLLDKKDLQPLHDLVELIKP